MSFAVSKPIDEKSVALAKALEVAIPTMQVYDPEEWTSISFESAEGEDNGVFTCWCGHPKSDHGPKTVDGYYRNSACLICEGFRCDEWQVEFCDWLYPDG